MKIIAPSAEALDVLRAGVVTEKGYALPAGQLERKLYAEIDKFLIASGGKWNRKERVHYFAKGTDGLRAAIEGGAVVDRKKTLEQFFTPLDLGVQLAELIGVEEGHRVLEPSAGDGRLVDIALNFGAIVTAVEIDSELHNGLLQSPQHGGRLDVICGDFMAQPRPEVGFDRVLMNPPFSRCQDIKHVRKAFDWLASGGRLAAIMSQHWRFAQDSASLEFRSWLNSNGEGEIEGWNVHEVEAGAFRSEGTGVNTLILLLKKAAVQ